jgi:hypothetical protein
MVKSRLATAGRPEQGDEATAGNPQRTFDVDDELLPAFGVVQVVFEAVNLEHRVRPFHLRHAGSLSCSPLPKDPP